TDFCLPSVLAGCVVSPARASAPPFPYTTLFRSEAAVDRWLWVARRNETRRDVTRIAGLLSLVALEGPGRDQTLAALERQAQKPIDRKSTRLNSSHQIISYAVFCLKKKRSDSSNG